MANRHKAQARASGGRTKYNAQDSNVMKEAEEKKSGGKVVTRKEGGKVSGFKSGGRLDKRARGGGVGADKHPFSSAKISG